MDVFKDFAIDSEVYSLMSINIAKNTEFALIMADIDGMLGINENFGYDAGDAALSLIAKNITDILPNSGKYRARDHFIILLPNKSKEDAFLVAEELRTRICSEELDYVSAEGSKLRVSVSIGVASYPEDGNHHADIYRRADSAMMRAKKAGRNRVMLAREEKLMPKTSHYTANQLEKLSLISHKTGVGEAALLREALDDLMRKYDN
ncbi:MAG: diguanylate cyclase [Defluviitaleaceae bacterium]|nr:diguanylate cyclase [Defluviitaleaceae bacterium]